MEPKENLLSPDLFVDSIAFTHLKETTKWSKFLAITGFIASFLLVLLILFGQTNVGNPSDYAERSENFMAIIVFIIIAAAWFFVSLFLYRFATKMKLALDTTDQENFNTSLYNLKMLSRVTGIIVIVNIALLLLAILGMVFLWSFN